MRYDLYIQNGGKKAISFLEGDEFVIDLQKGELRFFRDECPMHAVHAGLPLLTGSSSIQLKFQFRRYDAIIPEEADEYARLVSGLTWFDAERVGTDAKGRYRYRMCQGMSDERTKVNVRDLISVNTFNGDVYLHKGGGLYQKGSPSVELVRLASVYSFIEDEVFGTIQLIGILSRVEIVFSKVERGIAYYYCTNRILYRDVCEWEDEKTAPSRRLLAVA